MVSLSEVACKVHRMDSSWEEERREIYMRCARREHNIQRCPPLQPVPLRRAC